jgi:hypothetical protein
MDIDEASERDRTSDLLITNHARCGANCKRDNFLADYLWITCPFFVHFDHNALRNLYLKDLPEARLGVIGVELALGECH